jgi:hypothetical protein
MEQSVCSEAKIFIAIQKKKKSRTLRNPKADDSYLHSRGHIGSPLHPELDKSSPRSTIPFFKVHLNIILKYFAGSV